MAKEELLGCVERNAQVQRKLCTHTRIQASTHTCMHPYTHTRIYLHRNSTDDIMKIIIIITRTIFIVLSS